MWISTLVAGASLASVTSASYLGLLDRATRLCPAVVDTITVTVTVSVSVPAVTVTATPSVILDPTSSSRIACLSDAKATGIVSSWKTILTDTDHDVVESTAQELIADSFQGTSDSINSLAGIALGNTTFPSKNAFIASTLNASSISQLTTLDIFHDCSRIAFFWAATSIGSGVDEVKGVDLLYLTADRSQINMFMTEFNTLAWAKDVGWKIQKNHGTQF